MNRTQILLEKWQYEALKSLSEKKGASLSFLVRDAVAVYLRAGQKRPGLALDDIEGIGADARATGRGHDDVLYPKPRAGRR